MESNNGANDARLREEAERKREEERHYQRLNKHVADVTTSITDLINEQTKSDFAFINNTLANLLNRLNNMKFDDILNFVKSSKIRQYFKSE